MAVARRTQRVTADTYSQKSTHCTTLIFQAFKVWPSSCTSPRREVEIMQALVTFATAVAGLTLSLAIAILAEELFFGQVFRLLIARQAAQAANKTGR